MATPSHVHSDLPGELRRRLARRRGRQMVIEQLEVVVPIVLLSPGDVGGGGYQQRTPRSDLIQPLSGLRLPGREERRRVVAVAGVEESAEQERSHHGQRDRAAGVTPAGGGRRERLGRVTGREG